MPRVPARDPLPKSTPGYLNTSWGPIAQINTRVPPVPAGDPLYYQVTPAPTVSALDPFPGGKGNSSPYMFEKTRSMDIRCNPGTEEPRITKPGHKEGKDSRDSQSSLGDSYLKEQQATYSTPGASDNCVKSKNGGATDPDYCRRILVRGNVPTSVSIYQSHNTSLYVPVPDCLHLLPNLCSTCHNITYQILCLHTHHLFICQPLHLHTNQCVLYRPS